jgi:hypothetical protein
VSGATVDVASSLTIDEDVLRAFKVRAARLGKGDSEAIEEALRRDLGLEFLDRLWTRHDVPEGEAVEAPPSRCAFCTTIPNESPSVRTPNPGDD